MNKCAKRTMLIEMGGKLNLVCVLWLNATVLKICEAESCTFLSLGKSCHFVLYQDLLLSKMIVFTDKFNILTKIIGQKWKVTREIVFYYASLK
ncbi:hypothetical protein MAR_033353 [Mya arenaria]|uniref:Secreted protein n=1 Tax=Mya arenaria TaxID=6604 RepID=A0ABY7GCX4_MYAAR|nr:hypothetical protein MAR_033353 [Mya arenaria]